MHSQGKQVQALLEIKPSPLFAVIMRAINEWQLDHPSATADDCRQWLLAQWQGDGRVTWEGQVPAPVNRSKKTAKR